MDCRIIYYFAKKTSFCEKSLKKSLAVLDLKLSGAFFANKPEVLGERLREAFESCDICFIIGGLGFEDNRNIADVISNAASSSSPELIRKLKNPLGSDSYLLKAGRQLLIILPDEPAQIEEIMRGEISEFIKKSTHSDYPLYNE